MNNLPMRCVVDTNVPVTANGANTAASPDCVASSARALKTVMETGHVFIDDGGLIVDDYRANLSARGQPGLGDSFLKWILTNEWGGYRVTRVGITPKEDSPDDFDELPSPQDGVRYDPSDRKFLAVAAGHEEHPPILQSFDSKWWGWRGALAKAGISVWFLCPEEIERKHRQKLEN